MIRPAAALAGVGVICCALLFLWRADAMPSYLAAWLFWMALPTGAFPLVAAAEFFGIEDSSLLLILRRMLLMLPLGALLAVPILLDAGPLFHRAALPPRLAAWMAPPAFTIRMIVLLVLWAGLALLLARGRRDRPRALLGGIALLLHVVIASIAALDWVMSLAPGLNSSAFALLLIAAQTVAAASAALFVVAVTRHDNLPAAPGLLVIVLLGAWTFLHFTQYLVVWSADLPPEIAWYQQRTAPLGSALIWSEATIAALAIILLSSRLRRVPALAASVAAALLVARLLETLWLVTPAFRETFTVRLPDVVALIGLGGLSTALFLAVIGSDATNRLRHATI